MRVRILLAGLPFLVLAIGVACSTSDTGTGADDAADGGASVTPTTTATTEPTTSPTTAKDADVPGVDASAKDAGLAPDASSEDAGADASTLPACTGKKVLVLSDGNADTTTAGKNLFEAAGFTVTVVDNYGTYVDDGGVDAGGAAGTYHAIVTLAGANYPVMPSALQSALLAAHDRGTGLVFEEWTAYNASNGNLEVLKPAMLYAYAGWRGNVSITLSATNVSHPFWEGISPSFTTASPMSFGFQSQADAGNDSGAMVVATANVGDGGSDIFGMPVAFARDGVGRIAQTTLATNYDGENSLVNDENVKKLYRNMVRWVARCK